MGNTNLSAARKTPNDEFFTQLEDIENELKHYRDHFRDKTIFLNCDDPEYSQFWFYFAQNFNFFGLKRLISTHYTGLGSDNPPPSYVLELNRNEDGSKVDVNAPVRTDLKGDGDFRSEESIDLLKQADIVVSNPPFSLAREYVAQLMKYEKKFIFIGNKNAITYKEIWPYIQAHEMWLGATPMSKDLLFRVPKKRQAELLGVGREGSQYRIVDGELLARAATVWYTNLDNPRRHEDVILFRSYEEDPEKYPTYDNYDAIEVSKVVDIPMDFEGIMGVPITFLGKHNPDQFEIVGCSYDYGRPKEWSPDVKMGPSVGGKNVYKRIFIKRR